MLQTLSEKSRELDKLRSEWTSQSTSLSSRHMQDLTAEREKALEVTQHLYADTAFQLFISCFLSLDIYIGI